jgi:hypothetical protein
MSHIIDNEPELINNVDTPELNNNEYELIDNETELQFNSQFILCIEEFDKIKGVTSIDSRLFIGYNKFYNSYFIRGNRVKKNHSKYRSIPYAFMCDNSSDLFDFIEFVIDKRRTSLILYNFNNLKGREESELTYEFFESLMDRNYEVVGYDKVTINSSILIKYLNILKNTYNV